MAGTVELEGAFSYQDSSLHCEEVDLATLGLSTPCHVYSRSQSADRHKHPFYLLEDGALQWLLPPVFVL